MNIAFLCQDCAETGDDVCFSIFHRTLVEQSIEEGYGVAISLHGNSPPNNLIRNECYRHFVHSTWGRLGVGIRRKVNDCVLNDFRLQYPSSYDNDMGHRQYFAAQHHATAQPNVAVRPTVAVRPHVAAQPHITVRPHVAAQRHVQDAEAGDDEHSDDSSETRLQSDNDILVTWPEVPMVPVLEEAEEEDEVVP
jgi:hypothetical protein